MFSANQSTSDLNMQSSAVNLEEIMANHTQPSSFLTNIEEILASCLQSDLQVDLTIASKKLAIDFDNKF